MKKLLATVLILTALFTASCTKTELDSPIGMKLASAEVADYYLYVPDSWVIAQQTGMTSAYASVSDSTNVSCACYTVKNPDIYAIDTSDDSSMSEDVLYALNFWTGYRSELTAALPGYTEIGTPSQVKLDGRDAVVYTYTATLSSVNYKFSCVVCIINYKAYLLTFTSTAEAYANHSESFTEMINHFKFQTGIFE